MLARGGNQTNYPPQKWGEGCVLLSVILMLSTGCAAESFLIKRRSIIHRSWCVANQEDKDGTTGEKHESLDKETMGFLNSHVI